MGILNFSIIAMAQEATFSFTARKLLDIEKENGFCVEKKQYATLDSIFMEANKSIPFPQNPGKEKALEICNKIGNLLEKMKFSYKITFLLSEGLRNRNIDCNFYSILYYDILNKQHNYRVYPILGPGHMFIRWYLDGDNYFNYETTEEREYSDDQYKEILSVSKQQTENRLFLVPLNDTQLLSTNYIEMANTDMDNGKVAQSRNLTKKAMKMYMNFYTAYLMMAKIYLHENKNDSAIACYNHILSLDSLNYVILNYMGKMFRETGDHKQALTFFSRAVSINPKDPMLYFDRSMEYLSLNDVEKAMDDFTKGTFHFNEENLLNLYVDYLVYTSLEQKIMEKYLELNGGGKGKK